MKLKFITSVFLICFFISKLSFSQVTFYDVNTIQKIEVFFSQPNWDYQMDTAKYGAEGYIIADSARVNGVVFDSVGVKYKGNSSYDSTYIKNPIHIELDHTFATSYQGIADIKLSNGYADPSHVREVLSYDILKNYMDCPRANFAQLYINGNYIGLYSNAESINKDFCSKHFYSSSNAFFKCNPISNPGPTTKSNLRYIPLADSTGYFNFYELKSNSGWNELVTLCDTVTNYTTSIDNNMDMDRVMWMLAFNTIAINLDSYTGVFCQNYYVYKDNTNRFNPIVWDLNMSFGGFPFVGSGNSSMGSLTIANQQQLSPTFHAADPYWPLINTVMNNTSYKKQFIAHARTVTNENFANNNYVTQASLMQTVIDTAVQSDVNSFFTYPQFQNGLTANAPFGSYTIPGISVLMNGRVSYLQTNSDFVLVPPSITNVVTSTLSPLINDTVTVTTNVVNTNAVYLGYRSAAQDRFIRVAMFDDGFHNDGAANDNVYGAALVAKSLITQYYIYAENNDAGIFSPERAEHEFYTLQSQAVLPLAGQVVINEFLASNVNDTTNETGAHADWIELYNTTSTPLSLFGLYLSDDFTNPAKFQFSENTFIPANGYLTIWADDQNITGSAIHCNFKLSLSGEALMLSNGSTNVLDSISFGTQTNDVSMGRCPNGTGAFTFLQNPTFGAANCIPGAIHEQADYFSALKLFPNPANDVCYFTLNNSNVIIKITVASCTGQVVNTITSVNQNSIDIAALPSGIYFITFFNADGFKKQLKLAVLR